MESYRCYPASLGQCTSDPFQDIRRLVWLRNFAAHRCNHRQSLRLDQRERLFFLFWELQQCLLCAVQDGPWRREVAIDH